MSTLKTGALRGTSGTADSIQLHASNQSVTFPGAVTVTGALTSSTTTIPAIASGTWTITLADSLTIHSGWDTGAYYKIGNLVTVTGQMKINATPGNAYIKITNLPYAVPAGAQYEAVGAVRTADHTYDSTYTNARIFHVCNARSDSSNMEFYWNSGDKLSATANAYYTFTCTYITS